ncbi:MAG: ABC transporter, partial [Firmicutes bacterium]|nr:ABC transporter [Bacillota bacterium]
RGKTQELFDDPGTASVAKMTGCKNFSAAQRLDGHTLKLLEWGTELHLQKEIPEGICAIGYRAHFFEPVWGERRENSIPFLLSGTDELPFERRYYIRPEDGQELICWFVQDAQRQLLDERPAPDWLQLREESVMLLHE